ncbi:hypothetical protein FHS35_003888 [Streptomyces umbrinus]|nr:hypothetical protein [Streptomyces umbrinus]
MECPHKELEQLRQHTQLKPLKQLKEQEVRP